jgi:anti-sigma regulatory factor (Ser/Thr protein kinase)
VDADEIEIERRGDVCVHLSVPNRKQALEPARQALLGFLSGFAMSRQSRFNIELILEETLMNAILHSFKDAAEHRIELTAQVGPEEVVLQFEDDGVSFDPLQAGHPPARPQSIESATPGGLGLMLVRSHAASMSYRRSDGRNHLRIGIARG